MQYSSVLDITVYSTVQSITAHYSRAQYNILQYKYRQLANNAMQWSRGVPETEKKTNGQEGGRGLKTKFLKKLLDKKFFNFT
jgi:hypothetical protein